MKESEVAKEQATSLGINLVQVENVGNVSEVCVKVVRETMGRFKFQQELLRELSEMASNKERSY